MNKRSFKRGIFSLKGQIALVAMLIIFAAILIVAVSISLLSVSDLQMSASKEKSGQAFALADACIEEAILRLKWDSGYTGGTLNFDTGSCTISVEGTSNNRIITSSGTIYGVTRRIQAQISFSPSFDLTSWTEIP